MKNQLRMLAPALTVFLMTAAAPWASAQIVNPISAHIGHSFMIGEKTLPPGEYTFQSQSGSNGGIMTVQNAKGDTLAQFIVRPSIAGTTPKHSQLVFRKYGTTEFLSKIYMGGSKNGVSLTETSKAERNLASAGQKPTEETEEQP